METLGHVETTQAQDEERRIPLSRLDTHRDQEIPWKTENEAKRASETLEQLSGAFSTLIECVGEQPQREGLKRTPMRAAKALCYFTKGYEDNLTSKFCKSNSIHLFKVQLLGLLTITQTSPISIHYSVLLCVNYSFYLHRIYVSILYSGIEFPALPSGGSRGVSLVAPPF